MRTPAAVILAASLVSLTACGGFSAQEAHMVFDAANAAGFNAYRVLATESEEAGSRDTGSFTWTGSDQSFSFEGQVTGTSDWTGTITANGEVWWGPQEWHWTYGVGYQQVTTDDMTLDGALEWGLDVEGTGPVSGLIVYSAVGEINATGAATGVGAMDYIVTVEVDGSSLSFDAEGEVDGTPIDSSWTLTVAGL